MVALLAVGTYESSVGLFRLKQSITVQSAEVILLVDHSKFGERALCKVIDTSQINTVITDSKVSREALLALEEAGRKTIVAKVELSGRVQERCF